MPLTSWTDMMAPAPTNPDLRVFQMVQRRVYDPVRPMPQSGRLPEAELAVIDRWVAAGTPLCGPAPGAPPPPGAPTQTPGGSPPPGVTGSGGSSGGGWMPSTGGSPGGWGPAPAAGGSPGGNPPPPPPAGSGGSPGGPDPDPDPPPPGATEPEMCFELRAHQGQTPNDPTPFQVRPGEFYHTFWFTTPYDRPVTGLTFDALIDNGRVIHHFLLFELLGGGVPDGAHQDQLGLHPNSVLITGWAPGGDPPDMPPGVGQQLPAPGRTYELEIHYFNNTGAVALDRSGVKICVTSQPVDDVATITWLGTEAINVPARAQGTAEVTCRPRNPGRGDIHIVSSTPHMHTIGKHMKTVINRVGGLPETLVDEPFNFLDQRTYATPMVLRPGDTLTTTCTFENTTGSPVGWGPSTNMEMCYNFVIAYPADALANPGNSIEGAQNTCLW